MRASNLARKLIALNFSQKVFNFRKIYTPKFLGCYRHKFYKCPQFVKKMDKGSKKKLKPTIKSSLIYTKPNRKNKTKSNT
jgi:hypothetical protein